jgi:integrase
MASKSNKKSAQSKREKPEKPSPDYPLTAHKNGQWCKKVKGKIYFFGTWDDPDEALKCWLDDKDSLLAGRPRPSRTEQGKTLEAICEAFLAFQEERFDQEEISRTTLKDHYRVCKRLCDQLGKTTPIGSMIPEDFGRLKSKMAKTLSPLSLGIEIQRTKSVFRFAYEDGLIDKPIRYGRQFDKPARKQITKEKNQRGQRMFEKAEIKKLLKKTDDDPVMRSFILLGLNCGFGNRDCALLTRDAVDLKSGWINFPRPKTQRQRRCPLWPETLQALKEADKRRPDYRDDADSELFFLTTHGRCWARISDQEKSAWIDSLGLMFRRLMVDAGVIVPGRSFYGLRRTFRTVADETLDPAAIDLIMGHAADANDMADHYRQRIDDKRLKAVSNHVRKWVFPPKRKASPK